MNTQNHKFRVEVQNAGEDYGTDIWQKTDIADCDTRAEAEAQARILRLQQETVCNTRVIRYSL
jgi:hypothetical protein